MPLSFHPLEVVSVDRTAEDAVCLTLAVPQALRRQFEHHAGQYVTVRRTIDGIEERRTYSIVTAPGGPVLKLGVREQTGGRVSQELAARIRAGDIVEVGTPLGRFRTAVDAARALSYVAFASGSGITPVLSLATDILAREPRSRFTLVYGNRNIARTMLLEETLALKNRHLGRFAVHFVMSREPQHAALMNGRIDAAKVEALAREVPGIGSADEYFICGPGGMVDEVRDAVRRLNAGAPIRFERFAAGTGAGAAAGAGDVETPSTRAGVAALGVDVRDVLASISVIIDGRRRSFFMASTDASVLEAAERSGFELPFSCRAGICATCRTRIVAGGATMAHNIALEPWEVDAGFVLCCQARPTTTSLELSYDEK
jgi:ring-1,2-phenylacetyl-CoA epoxidase subunit PaaE